jgi:hypothetical protein
MANFTTCSFSLPIKITATTQIRLTLANSAVGATTVTATADAGTYYNNFDTTISGAATSIVGHLLFKLRSAELVAGTNGSWSMSELANATSPQYRGRIGVVRAKGNVADSVTSLEVLGGEVTLADLGSTVDPSVPFSSTTDPAFFIWSRRGSGHWVLPEPGLLASSEERQRSIQTATTSPDGTTVRDVYGSVTRKRIDLLSLPGAAVFLTYANDSDFAAVIGCETGDPAAALDELRRRWCLIDDDVSCRFYPNVDDLATFVDLRPGAGDDWMSSLDEAVEMVSEGPLFFDASLGAFKV